MICNARSSVVSEPPIGKSAICASNAGPIASSKVIDNG